MSSGERLESYSDHQRFQICYTGMAVAYAHIEPGVRLTSTISHPVESNRAVNSSTVRSFASNKPIICTVNIISWMMDQKRPTDHLRTKPEENAPIYP